MNFYITAIMFLIFEHINKVLTQGIPISPCPKIFQYRFDGTEWFGILSVSNPDFGQPLHLRVSLSMRGKPATNYLGELEMLTRGQYLSNAPVIYKIKFPKNTFPPKLLQIAANNQVICVGTPDHGIFVTQIQLEHTRKFTFLPEDMPAPIHESSSSSFLPPLGLGGGQSSSMSSTGMNEFPPLPTNVQFDTKHLPLTNKGKNPMKHSMKFCGTIDDRIRLQTLQTLTRSTDSMFSHSLSSLYENAADNSDSLILSQLLPRQSDENPDSRKAFTYATETTKDERKGEDDNHLLPPIVTSDPEASSESFMEELPAITRGTWPWLVAIYVNNITSLVYQCGGTLISSRIVISAAHCFQLFKKRYTANEVLVFLGRHNLKNWNEEGSIAAPVDDIFLHPDYNQYSNSYDADIAVLVLKHEVRFNIFIRPACLWSGSTKKQYIEGEQGIVVGWGLGGFNGMQLNSFTSPVAKIMSTPIVSDNVCFQANAKYHSLSSNRTFCAGIILQDHRTAKAKPRPGRRKQLLRGPCAGDSGAGLMIYKNRRWVLRGTVSGLLAIEPPEDDAVTSNTAKLTPTCSINQYVIYSDVAKFLDWIIAFML